MGTEKTFLSARVGDMILDRLHVSEEGYELNGKSRTWDLAYLPDNRIHLICEGRNYLIEVIRVETKKGTCTLRINGELIRTEIQSPFDQLLRKMGMDHVENKIHEKLTAPMPGMIVEIRVKPGDQVNPGDPLMILKAMKMENILKATGTGTVREILVAENDAVEKNQELILF